MRYDGTIDTAMGKAKLHGHFATLQFTRASAVTFAFFCRIQEAQTLPSHRAPPRPSTYFFGPLFSRFRLVLQHFGRPVCRGGLVRDFFSRICFFDSLARTSTRIPMLYTIFPRLRLRLRLRCQRNLPTFLLGHITHLPHLQGKGYPRGGSPPKALLSWLEFVEIR